MKIKTPYDILGNRHVLKVTCPHSNAMCYRCKLMTTQLTRVEVNKDKLTDALTLLETRPNKVEQLERMRNIVRDLNTAVEVLLYAEKER